MWGTSSSASSSRPGPEVTAVKWGDLVVSPFAISHGTCVFCREGLQTSCVHPQAGFWDEQPVEGAQGEAIRVPLADGTLVRLPAAADRALIPSLLTLADVLGTGQPEGGTRHAGGGHGRAP
jgi:threonine dehydrogenase-like Zn-dependent dehydrogenase